jgi:hypothetical protein
MSPILATLILGLVSLGTGLLAWSGIWRWGWVSRYRNEELPRYVRNTPFAVFWLGVGILLMAPILVCAGSWCGRPSLLLVALGIGFLAAALVFLFRPPDWTKPHWLVETERNNWTGYVETRRPRFMVPVGIVILVLALWSLTSGYVPVSLGAVIVGLGYALLAWRHQRSLKHRR